MKNERLYFFKKHIFFLVLLVSIISMFVFGGSSNDVDKIVSRGSNWDEECVNGLCNRIIYSKNTNIFDSGEYKRFVDVVDSEILDGDLLRLSYGDVEINISFSGIDKDKKNKSSKSISNFKLWVKNVSGGIEWGYNFSLPDTKFKLINKISSNKNINISSGKSKIGIFEIDYDFIKIDFYNYSVVKNKNNEVTYEITKNWTKYGKNKNDLVILDPIISLNFSGISNDTYERGVDIHGNEGTVEVGDASPGTADPQYGFFQMDISSIGSTWNVTNITFNIKLISESASNSEDCSLWNVSESWLESTLETTNQPDVDVLIDEITIDTTTFDYKVFDVTEEVKGWVDGNNNFGFRLLCGDVSIPSTDLLDFGSSESANGPFYNITYIEQKPNTTSTTIIKVDPVYTNQSLNCSTVPNDDINTTLTVNFIWFNDTGRMNVNETNVSCTVGQTCYTSIRLNESFISHFDNITCSARAYDGDNFGSYQNSSVVMIQNFNVTLASVDINDSAVTTTEDMNCTLGSIVDIDSEDTLTAFYDWFKDEVSQGIDSENLSSDFTSADEVWKCRSWIGDSYINSSNRTSGTRTIGSSEVSPFIGVTNATTFLSGLTSNSINPTNNDSLINFSVNFTDPNSNNWTAFFCSTADFSGGNCTVKTYCSSPVNLTDHNLSCVYNVSGEGASEIDYFAIVMENISVIQSAFKAGTFWVNHPSNVSSVTLPTLNNSRKNTNFTVLNVSCSDPNSEDTITYTYYNNLSGNFDLFYNGTSSEFNWTLLNETTYYWMSNCRDDSNYTLGNSSVFRFDVDTTANVVNVSSPLNGTVFSGSSLPIEITLDINVSGDDSNVCFYNVTLSSGSVVTANTEVNCSNVPNSINVSVAANNMKFWFFVNDTANNIVFINRTFSATISSGTSGGGGGQDSPIDCNLSLFRIETTNQKVETDFSIIPGGSKSKDFLIFNDGFNLSVISLSCDSESIICDFVEFDNKVFNVTPNPLQPSTFSMMVSAPPLLDELVDSEKYFFNVVGSDLDGCSKKLSVNVNVGLTFFSIATKRVTLPFSKLGDGISDIQVPAILLAFVLALIYFVIAQLIFAKVFKAPRAGVFINFVVSVLFITSFVILI